MKRILGNGARPARVRILGRIQNLLNVSAPAPSCTWDGWDGLKPYIPPRSRVHLAIGYGYGAMADRLFQIPNGCCGYTLHIGHPANRQIEAICYCACSVQSAKSPVFTGLLQPAPPKNPVFTDAVTGCYTLLRVM